MNWFSEIPSAVKWAAILAIVLGVLGTAWGVVRYIEAGERNRLIAEQLAKAVVERDNAIAERNRILARFNALPEVRQRLCAQREPTDGCCKPAPAECKP